MNKGIFGPNKVGDTYKPKKEHWHNAKRKDGKTRWLHDKKTEYYVFNLADEHDEHFLDRYNCSDVKWMNDDDSGLYSIVNQGRDKLGENGERLAFFPTPSNPTDPWHGYPVDSLNIKDKLIDHWYKIGIVDRRIYQKLLSHDL